VAASIPLRTFAVYNMLLALETKGGTGQDLSHIQSGAKRTHVFEMGYLPAISFFGVTSNQKFTFENLVQSTI
jgi:hypothetical protein